MAALFAFAAVVQVNDPDPVRWVAIYGAAGALSVRSALRAGTAGPPFPPALPAVVATVALLWAASILLRGPARDAYGHMFDMWEMKDAAVEEAREATGLVIVAAWMAVLAWRERREQST